MNRKIISLALSFLCLLFTVGCGQAETPVDTDPANDATVDTVTNPGTEADTETDDYLTTISGTYTELFPELSKPEYRTLWHAAAAPLVGEENADAATDMLLAMCTAEPYGPAAIEQYTENPDSAAFNCYFLGGVQEFVMDGHTITGLDAQGQEVFSHEYQLMDVENENDFIFYQSVDEDSGEFTYFAFSPDTMATTYHLEFRYAEDLEDLQSWYEGNYAYWNAAAIATDYSEETMENVIALFATENLSDAA